jgi:hypothetical protein
VAFRADYACLGKCKKLQGAAPIYELPTGSTHCPTCGSKRLQQLFNNPNVIARGAGAEPDWRATSSFAPHRATALLQDSFDAHAASRPARDMPAIHAGAAEREVSLPGGRRFIVPSAGQAAAMVGLAGPGRAMKPGEIASSVRAGNPVTRMLGYDHNGARTPQRLPTVVAGRPKG